MSIWGLGCARQMNGPDVLEIQPGNYAAAFNAAINAARQEGLPPSFVDRRAGIIETEPRVAGSLLEPWRTDNASLAQAMANTVAHLRRRVRFEFASTAFQSPIGDPSGSLSGPAIPGETELKDLTAAQDTLELRAWVYLERAEITGLRRSTWTRTKTHTSRVIDADTGESISGTTWVPISRDLAFERYLLSEVASQLPAVDPE